MRTKSLEGWKRKSGHLTSTPWTIMSAMKVKIKHGAHLVLFAVGMACFMGATIIMRMHLQDLHDESSQPGNNDSGVVISTPVRVLGTGGDYDDDDESSFHCDRSQFRTDICNMRGDVRMVQNGNDSSKSFVLYARESGIEARTEKVKPYTRKWEEGSMGTVNEVTLVSQVGDDQALRPKCDVEHKVPGVVFSTGGYTGNLYHEFNDGLIPLFISSQHLRREVVVIISSYHDWWYSKNGDVVRQMSNYEVVDLERDTRVHCFPEVQVGLDFHGELSVTPERMPNGETVAEFRELLNRAYTPELVDDRARIRAKYRSEKPRLTIIVRKQTRQFLNLEKIVELGERLGFKVRLLAPEPETELKKIFWLLDNTDVLLGVHGAAMTHFLFMRPGTVFIQVVPLGTDWAANEYYGEPAVKLGLRYVPYKIRPEESSLSDHYNATDPVLVDPERITQQGWGSVKSIYLEGQDVRPSLSRMREVLTQAKSVVKKARSKPHRAHRR